MMIPIERSPYQNIYEPIMEQVTKKSVYFDRVYTQPLGWVRFIQENNRCNKYYLKMSEPDIVENGNVVFDFDLDQEVDPELEDVETLYCVCRLEDALKVFEVQRYYAKNIRILFANGVAEFSTLDYDKIEPRRSFVIPLDTEAMKKMLT